VVASAQHRLEPSADTTLCLPTPTVTAVKTCVPSRAQATVPAILRFAPLPRDLQIRPDPLWIWRPKPPPPLRSAEARTVGGAGSAAPSRPTCPRPTLLCRGGREEGWGKAALGFPETPAGGRRGERERGGNYFFRVTVSYKAT
jgi:hypothetical protein